MSIRNWLIAASLLVLPASAYAEDGRVIGDSIGVGVSWAAKIPSTAKNSVSIYSGAIMEQLHQAQKGETVFMSLGTNDAVGGALDVKAKVAAIVAEADKLGRQAGLDRSALRAEALGGIRQEARRHSRRPSSPALQRLT